MLWDNKSMKKKKKLWKLSTFQIIIYSFAVAILVGALLLCLPFATRDGRGANFFDALFTSTSAVCVTGLVVKDTWQHWSLFGRIIIISLIQIGGLGIITVTLLIFILAGKKISLDQRLVMKDAISADKVGGILRLTSFIFRFTFFAEITGALLLSPVFIGRYGVVDGIGYSLFHSVSAFCNAGFDLEGEYGAFSSLCPYHDNPLINIVIMCLIVSGGLGFLTWKDILDNRWRIRKYSVQSKGIMMMTVILIFVPALYFYFTEFNSLEPADRFFASLFQSVTTRTAGFNTQDLASLTDNGKIVMMVLMLIGGAPGSTAGGMKVTTILVLLASSLSTFRDQEQTVLLRRTIKNDSIKKASSLFMMYIFLFLSAAMVISHLEKIDIMTCMFETASAIGTVGLSLGITSTLSLASRMVLILLMYFGRVGGLTIIFAAVTYNPVHGKYPAEDISVG